MSLSVSLLRLNRAKSSGELLLGSPRASNRIAMTLVPAKPSPNRSSLEEKPRLHCNKMTYLSKCSSNTYIIQIHYLIDRKYICKVEKILKGSLDSILLPSPSVKIQIMGGKVYLRCKGKTLLGIVNKLFVFKS